MNSSGIFNNKNSKHLEVSEFKQIYLDYYPALILYASKFIHDIDISKDIVQEVLTRFWLENDKLRNKNLVKPYLYKSVKNRALNYKRIFLKKSAIEEVLDAYDNDLNVAESPDAFVEINYEHLQNDLKNAMDELPEKRRKIFEMSRFQKMKHKEIAEELDISPKTVETQIYRSLCFLRERLKHHLA